MAIFPVSPTVGQEETVLGRTFVYDGYGWVAKVSGGHTILDPAGNTMPTQDALQFGNGLSVTDNTIDGSTQIKLGGNITEDLYITSAGNNFVFIDSTYLGGIAGFGMLGATPVLGFSDYIGLINITSDNIDSLLGVNRTDGRVTLVTKSNIQDSISSITLSSGESTIIYYDEETGHCRIALSNSGITVQDTLSDSGMKYERDYSANFTDRSLVDKGYVDSAIIAGSGHVIKDAAGTDMPTQPALQFGAGFTVTDETGKTVVERDAIDFDDIAPDPAKGKKLAKVKDDGTSLDYTDYGYDEVVQKAQTFNEGTLKKFDVNGNDVDSGLTGESLDIYAISPSLINALTNESNWRDGGGNQIVGGVVFASGIKGQRYYSDEFFYECIADNNWARTYTGRPVINIYDNPALTLIFKGYLEDTLNWVGKIYIGPAITGVAQGTRHYDNDYMYEFFQTNVPIRYSRD